MKKIVFLLIFLVLMPFIKAEDPESFDEARAYEWLFNESVKAEWNMETETLALSILVLSTKPQYDISEGIEKLKSQESENWWGDPIKSSLALYALNFAGENVSEEINRLKESQIIALTGGSWLIQLKSNNDQLAECSINFEEIEHNLQVINNTIVSQCDTNQRWLNFENCIQSPLKVHEEFTMECVNGDDSLIYRSDNGDYYIIKQNSPYSIDNGCFTNGGSCSCKPSGYASWVLDRLNDASYSVPYLRANCDAPLDNAFLFMITSQSVYGDLLVEQKEGNEWGDLESTSFAIRSLKRSQNQDAYNDALFALKLKQRPDGSWNGDLKDTATVLFAVFTDAPSTISGGSQPSGATCGDGIIEGSEQCDGDSLACLEGESCLECSCQAETSCTVNDECVSDSECSIGFCDPISCGCVECKSDLDCGPLSDNICVDGRCVSSTEENECSFDSQCGENQECIDGSCFDKGKSLNFLFIILGILVVLGIGFFVYWKFLKGKGLFAKKRFSPRQQPTKKYPVAKQSIQKPRPIKRRTDHDSDIENKLDESLKKARDLLRRR